MTNSSVSLLHFKMKFENSFSRVQSQNVTLLKIIEIYIENLSSKFHILKNQFMISNMSLLYTRYASKFFAPRQYIKGKKWSEKLSKLLARYRLLF